MQQGTIRVPAEAVRGMFAEGAFRQGRQAPRAIRDETAQERYMAVRTRQHAYFHDQRPGYVIGRRRF